VRVINHTDGDKYFSLFILGKSSDRSIQSLMAEVALIGTGFSLSFAGVFSSVREK
jgi:hypothetical protein